MKIAIVHDWLVTYAGSERVLEQILNLYPEADIFSIVDFLPADKRSFIHNKKVTTSFIQKLPKAKQYYRSYLPLMPLAIEQFDLSKYDLILSISHAIAKSVITGPDQIHISYINSPIRYAWDMQSQYLKESGLDHGIKGWLAKFVLHYIRIWDCRSANGVDYIISNSNFISKRVWKCYRRESTVIYPPVDIEGFCLGEKKEAFYLTASRMVPYKKMDLIVEAFTKMPDKKLIVIGDGPDFKKIKSKASENIMLLGYQDFEVLRDYMQRAKAFVFAAEEDFGIIPVEVQACGTPVIAYGKGGALETVKGLEDDMPTGVFFYEQNARCICKAVNEFERNQKKISPKNCRKNAESFSVDIFKKKIKTYINSII